MHVAQTGFGRIAENQRVRVKHIDRRVGIENRQLRGQVFRLPRIIRVEMSYKAPTRRADAGIARRADATVFLLQIADARLKRLQHALEFFRVRRTIVDDDHFIVCKSLGED